MFACKFAWRRAAAILSLCAFVAMATRDAGTRHTKQGSAGAATACVQAAPAVLDAPAGRVWRACALGAGMVIGGALGSGVNPLGGAFAISLGLHAMLFFCT